MILSSVRPPGGYIIRAKDYPNDQQVHFDINDLAFSYRNLRTAFMTDRVVITETGMRDGLQNQPTHVSTKMKLKLADALVKAGVDHLEATSFVHPKAFHKWPMLAMC